MAPRAFLRKYRFEAVVFFCALAVRLLLVGYYLAFGNGSLNWGANGGDYSNEALNLLHGYGFSRAWEPPYIPDAIRTPLYPLFLAAAYALFGTFAIVPVIEAVLSSLLPVIFVRMARMFVKNDRVILAGALFLCVEPHFVFNTIFFGSEGISIILLTWGLFEILKVAYTARPDKASLRAGLALGLATLARPITTYLPLALLPLFFYEGWRTRSLNSFMKYFGIFVCVFILMISPWLVRNYLMFGTAGMGTVGWFNVYTRLAATIVAIDTGDDFYTSYHKLLDELSVRGYVTHPPPVSEYEIQDPRFADTLRTESLRILQEHPGALVRYLALYPVSVLTQDNTLGYLGNFGLTEVVRPPFSPTLYAAQHGVFAMMQAVSPYLASPYAIPYIMRTFFVLLFFFAVGGAWILLRGGKTFAALLLFGFIGYVVLFSLNAGGQIDGRYRSQFLISETLLALVAFEYALERRKRFMRSIISA